MILEKLYRICRSAAHDSCAQAGFSLVEMLMALLVASLLMVSLAPVMTKKFNETVTIGGGNQFVHEVAYGSSFCPVGAEPKKYEDGTEYCEGEFTVPMGVNKIEVTLVGGGGGGAAAATAGLWEKKESGTENFTVPQLVNQLEVTLVGGGAGGGAGGQTTKNVTFVTNGKENFTQDATNIVEEFSSGEKIWTVPEAAKEKYGLMTACGGGGGGGGGGSGYSGGGGGSGGYFEKKPFIFPDLQNLTIRIGGGGGKGGHDGRSGDIGYNWGGGAGGRGEKDMDSTQRLLSASQGGLYGSGGLQITISGLDPSTGGYGAVGGGGNGQQSYGREVDTEGYNYGTNHGGEAQGGAGKGGDSITNKTSPVRNAYLVGSGGGGGSYLAGGGGGGSSSGNGGGGGGPTWIMELGTDIVAPGGGGGAGSSGGTGVNPGGGGGGGGGKGGGNGGNSILARAGQGGTGGTPGGGDGALTAAGIAGLIVDGEKQATIFGNGYCDGGIGDIKCNGCGTSSTSGKDGAMKLTYLDYGPGGSGGGGGSILPLYQIPVTPWETLSILVGKGGNAQNPGNISDSGKINKPAGDGYNGNSAGRGQCSYIKRKGANLNNSAGLAEPGCPSGVVYAGNDSRGNWCGQFGWGMSQTSSTHSSSNLFNSYFSTMRGYSAGNIYLNAAWTHAAGSTGGDGAQTKLFGKTDHCKAGRGGKTKYTNEDGEQVEFDLEGGDAEGYGGCAGGGGWSMHKSGKGAPGYARVTWNKTYKLNTMDEYEYINGGSGGGGSAGNVFRYSIKVQGGDVLKYKIGKGGTGGGWTLVDGVLTQVEPTNGGMTELKTANNEILRAGGGLAGAFPLLNTLVVKKSTTEVKGFDMNAISYGLGGAAPNLCEFVNSKGETESFIDKEKLCTNKAGEDGSATGGGKGADAGFGAGTGGLPGATGGKTAANGSPAVGFGAGGGGAGLADLGTVNATDAVTNPTVGGNGGDGKIIFRWK